MAWHEAKLLQEVLLRFRIQIHRRDTEPRRNKLLILRDSVPFW